MERAKFQVAIIGGGPGGYTAALRCAELGLKTVCIEDRPLLGGTCLNVGCIPSKTLLHTSWLYEEALKSHKLGITADPHIDVAAMMHHKDEVVASLASGVAGLFKQKGVTHRRGRAHLTGPNLLAVENDEATEEIAADHIILAAGSIPIALPGAPFDERRVLSSTGALALGEIPASLLVVGAGAIGLELASVYRRFGTTVTVIEMLDHVSPGQDKAVSKALQRILERQGLIFHLGARVTEVRTSEDKKGISVGFQKKDAAEERLTADYLLVAVGRRPAVATLALENVGITPDAKGFIPVDDQFRTSQPHIYAIGDLIGGPGLAHRASEEGIAVAQIIAGQRAFINYLAIPNVIYTDPEVASVGLTEEAARGYSLDIAVGVAHFRGNARARCTNSLEGFVKIIGDKSSQRLLGMHILGPQASELIATGALAMAGRGTVSTLAYATYAHPTLSETIKEAALNAIMGGNS